MWRVIMEATAHTFSILQIDYIHPRMKLSIATDFCYVRTSEAA